MLRFIWILIEEAFGESAGSIFVLTNLFQTVIDQ
jgi:hypothetical protein